MGNNTKTKIEFIPVQVGSKEDAKFDLRGWDLGWLNGTSWAALEQKYPGCVSRFPCYVPKECGYEPIGIQMSIICRGFDPAQTWRTTGFVIYARYGKIYVEGENPELLNELAKFLGVEIQRK